MASDCAPERATLHKENPTVTQVYVISYDEQQAMSGSKRESTCIGSLARRTTISPADDSTASSSDLVCRELDWALVEIKEPKCQ